MSMKQLGYDEDKLFSLYHQARVYGHLPSSPDHCATPMAGKRILGRVRLASQDQEEGKGFSGMTDIKGFDIFSLVKKSNKQ